MSSASFLLFSLLGKGFCCESLVSSDELAAYSAVAVLYSSHAVKTSQPRKPVARIRTVTSVAAILFSEYHAMILFILFREGG